jgi:hypothetical protein
MTGKKKGTAWHPALTLRSQFRLPQVIAPPQMNSSLSNTAA